MRSDRRFKQGAGRSLLSTTNETPDNARKPSPREIVRAVRKGEKNPFLQGSAPNIAFAFAEELERRSRDTSNPQLARTSREALDAHDPPEVEVRGRPQSRLCALGQRANERQGFSLMASVKSKDVEGDDGDAPDPSRLQPDQPRFWEVRGWTDVHLPSQIPVVNLSQDRIRILLEDRPAVFEIAEDPDADSGRPWYFLHEPGRSAVEMYNADIQRIAAEGGVDPDLVRAIMYVENSQGYYGHFTEAIGVAESILPMNIRPDIWSGLIATPVDFHEPDSNIRAAVELIHRIQERVVDPTPAKIGSLYNSAAKERVSDFGARVQHAYDNRSWALPPQEDASP